VTDGKPEYPRDCPVGRGSYTVGDSECVESIAAKRRVSVEDIWSHPKNEALVASRGRPNTLLPGDRLTLPPSRPSAHEVQAGYSYVFVATSELSKLRVVVAEHGDARNGVPYAFYRDGALVGSGTVANGVAECEVPVGTAVVHLLVDGLLHTLSLRKLNPVATPSGAQQRLINLGYVPGKVDGVLGPRTRAALRAFQEDHDLPERSGDLDRSTQDKLTKVHGS